MPFNVTVLPTRPDMPASIMLPKPDAIWPSDVDPPVRQHPKDVAIDRHGFGFVDDQRAGKPATQLLQAVGVRVVPEGPGVWRRELVVEGFCPVLSAAA